MTPNQFQQLIAHPGFLSRERVLEVTSLEVKETHISYVILTEQDAYKIKKTVKHPFLDFSTLALRQHFCREELRLNQRLAPRMYRSVLPVQQHGGQFYLGEGEGNTVDYALKMQRMDNQLEMDQMLRRDEVEARHIVSLAHRIADFHGAATVVHPTYTVDSFQHLFAPLGELIGYLDSTVGHACAIIVRRAIATSAQFVKTHLALLQQRSDGGLVRDGHGDLHSKNIFLTEPPTLFDCIEFNAAYRQIDLLNEIAFLCMDLEAYGADAMSELFYREYLIRTTANGLDRVGHKALLTYFKLYRANVRAKVLTLQMKEKNQPAGVLEEIKSYLRLMERYGTELEAITNSPDQRS